MTVSRRLAAIIALTTLAGCARQGPPAPLLFPDAPARKSPLPTLVPQAHLPHPSQIVVAKGENLYTLSHRYDVPLRSIIDANHLDPPFQVAAGTKLDLPQERFHVVQPGDTLYGIARLYGVEVSTLASLNHLTAPYALRSGQTLYLPASVEAPEKPAAIAETTEPPPKPEAAAPAAASTEPTTTVPAQTSDATAAATAAPAPELVTPAPHGGAGFEWPVAGHVIEGYGTGPNGTHNDGINIAVRAGEPVRAADGGVVAYAGNELRGYGNLVLIRHPGGYMTAYAHNGQLLVKRGDAVKRGQEIAKAGASGAVDSPQLHFEIRQGTHALDPTTLLPSLRASN